MTWKVKQFGRKPKLKKPVLIEGLPGIGNVGKVVVDFIRAQGVPDYTLFETFSADKTDELSLEDRDEFYQQAKDLVLATGQASISYIQRRLKIGYNRAARIMEMMEDDGIVGPPGEAGKPREILRRRV